MTDSRSRAGGVQDELGTSCYAGKKDILKEWWGLVEGHRSQLEEPLLAKSGSFEQQNKW